MASSSPESIVVPPMVADAVARALGRLDLQFRPALGGTNARTFVVEQGEERWIVRIEPGDGLQLRRAHTAQDMARAAGVRVPSVVAHDFTSVQPESWLWVVEEYVVGEPFDVLQWDAAGTHAISYELGAQLRALHAVPMERFGLVEPNPYPAFGTFAEWIDHQASRIAHGLRIANIPAHVLPAVEERYSLLRSAYSDVPRLCHGDTSGANLLAMADGHLTLIDWEWARGADPAWNIGYWFFWHQNAAALDSLLRGYQPDDTEDIRRRVLAYEVFQAVDLILVYADQDDPAGIAFTRRRLAAALGDRAWT